MSTSSRVPGLDGLRGVAIIAVIVFHAQVSDPKIHIPLLGTYGWGGVDLFFVLSGFLITGILLDGKGQGHYFRNFYARRALRIWPLYYLLLLFAFMVIPLAARHVPGLPVFQQNAPWWLFALYFQNLADGIPVGPILGGVWSLAIEEQFYMFWPLIVFFARRKTVINIAVGVLLLSPVVRLLGIVAGASPIYLYGATFFRLDGLAFGALIACIVRGSYDVRRFRAIAVICAIAGAIGFVLIKDAWILYSLIALLSAGVLMTTLTVPQVASLLQWSVLRYTGRISYCLYLVHSSVITLVGSRHFAHNFFRPMSSETLNSWIVFTSEVAISYLLATISWYGFESQILKLKSRFSEKAATSAGKFAMVQEEESPAHA